MAEPATALQDWLLLRSEDGSAAALPGNLSRAFQANDLTLLPVFVAHARQEHRVAAFHAQPMPDGQRWCRLEIRDRTAVTGGAQETVQVLPVAGESQALAIRAGIRGPPGAGGLTFGMPARTRGSGGGR